MLRRLLALKNCGRLLVGVLAPCLTACAGAGAHEPRDVADLPGLGWALTYPVSMDDAERLVPQAAAAVGWRPVDLPNLPPHVHVFDTSMGMVTAGIYGRVKLEAVDEGHTAIGVNAIKKNEAQPLDMPGAATQRMHMAFFALVARKVTR